MDREEDYQLVRRMGSPHRPVADAAFEQLYLKYRDRVYSTALHVLCDPSLAADAVQVTFLSVYRNARRFDFRAAFSSWLYRVALNQCIDLTRRRRRIRAVSLAQGEAGGAEILRDARRSEPPDPVDEAGRSELREEIRRAIGRLSPRLSSVVVLRYLEGLSYEEISEILEAPVGTVKSRLNRAHAALEADLGPRLDEAP